MITFSLATLLCCFAASLCLDLESFCRRFVRGLVVNDVCLYVPRQTGTFDEAVAYCEAEGGELAFPESKAELAIMQVLCEDYGSPGFCLLGLIHSSECNFVSYTREEKVPSNSPWWHDGNGIHDTDCEIYNRAAIFAKEKRTSMVAVYDGEDDFICKLRRDPLKYV